MLYSVHNGIARHLGIYCQTVQSPLLEVIFYMSYIVSFKF